MGQNDDDDDSLPKKSAHCSVMQMRKRNQELSHEMGGKVGL